MSPAPYRFGLALGIALFVWMSGFVWGSIVFMTPALKEIPEIPHISKYPAISFPLLVVWIVAVIFLARFYLRETPRKASEGLKFGLVLALVNLLLDLLVIVFAFGGGWSFFSYVSIWVAYISLVVVPWLTGRRLEARA